MWLLYNCIDWYIFYKAVKLRESRCGVKSRNELTIVIALKMAQFCTANKKINIWEGMNYIKCLIEYLICITHERCKWDCYTWVLMMVLLSFPMLVWWKTTQIRGFYNCRQHFHSRHSFYDRFNAMSSQRFKWGLGAAYLRIQIWKALNFHRKLLTVTCLRRCGDVERNVRIKRRIAMHLHSNLTMPKLPLSAILQMQIYMPNFTHMNDHLQDQAQRSSLLTQN